jgi:hypothetical protein
MDGLIVIRSVTLSNHIARTRLPEGVVAGYHRVLGGRGRDNAITPEEGQELQRPSIGRRNISNNPSFRLKHPGVLDGSDGSDRTLYPLTENYTLPIAYSPPLLCAGYTHHQNDMCVTLFTGAAVMLWPLTKCLAMFMPLVGR